MQSQETRRIDISPGGRTSTQQQQFCTNKIVTSRYTWWNFLPLSIAIQFAKVGNCAWLCVAILNAFPAVSVNSPLVVGSTLCLILLIGVLKEGFTDYARHRSDAKINQTQVVRMQHSERVSYALQDVKVGDVIFLGDG